jgi:hypothetical protein
MLAKKWIVAALMVAAGLAPSVQARPSDDDVKKGIKSIIDALYAQQLPNGTWDLDKPGADHVTGVNWGGTTALITYALLSAGESYQNPKLTRAIEYLKNTSDKPDKYGEIKATYAIGLRAHVWSHLPPQFEKYLQKDIAWLLSANGGGPAGGGYQYLKPGNAGVSANPAGGPYDNSVTQYGVLGVWEGAKRSLPIGTGYWKRVEDHFLKTQNPDGGWHYNDTPEGSYGSMTAAGLAALFITQDYLHNQDYHNPGVTRKSMIQDKINGGLDWFDKNFDATTNPGKGGFSNYWLMGVERVGLACGYKYFNGKDWYAEGADALLKAPGTGADAAFALLFLVRGRVPVLLNKLSLGKDFDWNNRPRDVAKLSEWISDEVENHMNFQIVGIENKPEDWLDAPMLYIASDQPINGGTGTAGGMTDEQAAKIKRYIDLGGMLVTTADTGSGKFNKSIEQLVAKWYPDLHLAPVKDDDMLMNIVFQIKGEKIRLQSVNNGIRHVVLHIPTDISWNFHSSNHTDPTPWQLFVNAYFYATEKGRIRARLDQHFVERKTTGGGPKIAIGRAKYDGNWNPEPLAWEVQSNYMFNNTKADLAIQEVDLASLPKPADVPFVHVTGTVAMTFTQTQIDGIKAYADAGGVILFENAGGRGAFAESVNQMLAKAYPKNRLKPVSTQAALITGAGTGGVDCKKVDYRSFAILKMGQINAPRLMGVSFDDVNPRILVSGEDLTSAMLDQPVWGVFGYDNASAQKLMTNIVLYANSHLASAGAPAVTPAPAPGAPPIAAPAPAPAAVPAPAPGTPAPAPTAK